MSHNTNSRITPQDDGITIIHKISEGNPGAVTVLMLLFKHNERIDPQSWMGPLGTILDLDTHGIYGSNIWILFKDICKQDIVMFVALFRAVQLGIISSTVVKDVIDRKQGVSIDLPTILEAVKSRLEYFNPEPIKQ